MAEIQILVKFKSNLNESDFETYYDSAIKMNIIIEKTNIFKTNIVLCDNFTRSLRPRPCMHHRYNSLLYLWACGYKPGLVNGKNPW